MRYQWAQEMPTASILQSSLAFDNPMFRANNLPANNMVGTPDKKNEGFSKTGDSLHTRGVSVAQDLPSLAKYTNSVFNKLNVEYPSSVRMPQKTWLMYIDLVYYTDAVCIYIYIYIYTVTIIYISYPLLECIYN